MIDVKIQILSDLAVKPEYATDGSLGMDLSAAIDKPITIKKGERVLIPTGFAMQIPEGFGGFIFPRSGLSFKKGITMANCVGVIDTDYTGEVKVSTVNISDEDYVINPKDRIAQLVFLPVSKATFIECETLEDTDRGTGGFGSTGE